MCGRCDTLSLHYCRGNANISLFLSKTLLTLYFLSVHKFFGLHAAVLKINMMTENPKRRVMIPIVTTFDQS